jgi:hypothetical protein
VPAGDGISLVSLIAEEGGTLAVGAVGVPAALSVQAAAHNADTTTGARKSH